MTADLIPIQNIYYLLCYAWNKLAERDIVSVQPLDSITIIDLFAKVLANGMTYIMRRGLDRGYLVYHEQISSIRGQIDFGTTLKTTFFRHPSVYCEYDELSHNIIHNQIIRTTIARILNVPGINSDTKNDLNLIQSKLRQISIIPLTKKHFSLVKLHSNNYFYDFLLKICELIYDNLLISEEDGSSKFKDFLRDEKAMARLFEDFVRNFFRLEQTVFDVGSEIINWQAVSASTSSLDLLPAMRTDISLTSPNRKIIIDTKYYSKIFQIYYEKESIHSSNLYQLFAYLQNLDYGQGDTPKCEGILLYPTVEKEICLEYTIKGHKVSIRTINLNQDWKDIRKNLLALVS